MEGAKLCYKLQRVSWWISGEQVQSSASVLHNLLVHIFLWHSELCKVVPSTLLYLLLFLCAGQITYYCDTVTCLSGIKMITLQGMIIQIFLALYSWNSETHIFQDQVMRTLGDQKLWNLSLFWGKSTLFGAHYHFRFASVHYKKSTKKSKHSFWWLFPSKTFNVITVFLDWWGFWYILSWTDHDRKSKIFNVITVVWMDEDGSEDNGRPPILAAASG